MKGENELLTRYFDGELPREALSPELQAEVDAFDRAFEASRREPITAPAWLRTAVMGLVRATPRPRWRLALDWLLTPRLVRLKPVTVALVLVSGIAIGAVLRHHPQTGPGLPAQAQAPDDLVTTRFVLVAPEASSVAVTGDFVGWEQKGIALERDPSGNGLWVGVVRLRPGVHQYAFVVDGSEWRPDPNAVSQLDDGFGQKNSVLLVPPPARS